MAKNAAENNLGIKHSDPRLHIVIDSREQNPFTFAELDCSTSTGTLMTGDYSISGAESEICVERKSLPDLLSCFTSGRERFMHEMERMRAYRSCIIIVESPFQQLMLGNYRSHVSPDSATQSVISIIQNYRIPFLFCQDRKQAEKFTFDFLRHYFRHESQRFKKMFQNQF